MTRLNELFPHVTSFFFERRFGVLGSDIRSGNICHSTQRTQVRSLSEEITTASSATQFPIKWVSLLWTRTELDTIPPETPGRLVVDHKRFVAIMVMEEIALRVYLEDLSKSSSSSWIESTTGSQWNESRMKLPNKRRFYDQFIRIGGEMPVKLEQWRWRFELWQPKLKEQDVQNPNKQLQSSSPPHTKHHQEGQNCPKLERKDNSHEEARNHEISSSKQPTPNKTPPAEGAKLSKNRKP
ncbi:hypothetical protein LXL04_016416 [Taraxacum kok-saghyz]